MAPGDHGVLLTIKTEGKEIKTKLVINLLGMVMEE
jgi:hypothetical protein